ncbi:MAG TPA: hypothetical protein PKH77_21625 [Anaerolineae bacterium]|nr:hypothetical protein [Anaerolineae bacterium]
MLAQQRSLRSHQTYLFDVQFTEPDEVEEKRKGHLFSVEEAIAIYIIARYLTVGITEVA